ncbi:bifunctional riboflavin kinase/FAD synthetase [Aphanothece sacrum]|uniref:Riboflavin biosynthesis protein n=1 Tax=Aphanothece sacrum FPU1 TaxID=1920663 RepID=A0A401IJD7_APHSA|nr:bifunctional riboflavin kinase/FAD synthetase [Aphanothece sacrum]GBF81290.1 riboflavin kinase [Aphanothece sacrum FPU1]GBF83360.1 riboflavin kinase [Aphanothece sacrum FPU3]
MCIQSKSSVRVTSSTVEVLTPTAIALGNFDGIHLGHQQVLAPILYPPETILSLKSPPYPTIVTFTPHPQEFFSGQPRQLLTPLWEKVQHLEQLGIVQLVQLPFDRELAVLSPQEFVANILVKQLQTKTISIGQDFRFGRGRMGTAEDLQEIAASFGVSVHITSLKTDDSPSTTRISSSLIRQCLTDGNIPQANLMLGYSYSLIGTVVPGQQMGRTLGFPTANLKLPSNKFIPRHGVYCVRVYLETQQMVNGVINIGHRPTLNGQIPTIEVHLLDWSGDLYQQTLTVTLEKFLRPERRFPSLEALKEQITSDCHLARKFLEELNK